MSQTNHCEKGDALAFLLFVKEKRKGGRPCEKGDALAFLLFVKRGTPLRFCYLRRKKEKGDALAFLLLEKGDALGKRRKGTKGKGTKGDRQILLFLTPFM